MRWVIYYTDGTTYSNEDGEPADAPGGGVLAIAQEDSVVGSAIHSDRDFYCFDEQFSGWCGMDYFGFVPYLMEPGSKIIKLGKSMSTNRYRAMLDDIRNDPNMPNKSARYTWEAPIV